jgi:hypothetical protein
MGNCFALKASKQLVELVHLTKSQEDNSTRFQWRLDLKSH